MVMVLSSFIKGPKSGARDNTDPRYAYVLAYGRGTLNMHVVISNVFYIKDYPGYDAGVIN